jgi:hypothetical protein
MAEHAWVQPQRYQVPGQQDGKPNLLILFLIDTRYAEFHVLGSLHCLRLS